MEHINILLSGFLFASAILTTYISIYSIAVKRAPIAVIFSLLCFCFTIYSIGYAMELYSQELSRMLFWNYVQYTGIPFLPAFWILLALQYDNNERFLTPGYRLLILVMPVATLVIKFTDRFHHLYYAGVKVISNGWFPVLSAEKGPWYLMNGVYMGVCIYLSGWIYLRRYKRHAGPVRKQCIIMLVASLLPMPPYLLLLFGISPFGIDLVPFIGTVVCLLFLVVLFRFQFLDLKPLARDRVFESTGDGIIVLDTKLNIIDFNPRASEIIPELKGDAYNKNIRSVLAGYGRVLNTIQNRSEGRFKVVSGSETSHYNIKMSEIYVKNKFVTGLTVTMTDVTKYIEAMEKLNFLASRDELTGLFNRRQLFSSGSCELERARRYGHAFSLIILDLDFFKSKNDEYGHQAGDLILRTVSEICRQSLRSIDILGRLGGEEFVIILPETGLGEAVPAAERLRKNIESSEIRYEKEAIRVTASLGVAGAGTVADETLDSFLRNADRALYRAKSEGRNCVRSEG